MAANVFVFVLVFVLVFSSLSSFFIFVFVSNGGGDSQEKREWLQMWDEARQFIADALLQKDQVGFDEKKFDLFSFQLNEQEMRQADGEESRRDEEKAKEERKLLIDVFTVKRSTGESEFRAGERDFGHKFGQMSWDRSMRFYAEAGHRRAGLKWIQTTNETEHLFKSYKLGDHLRELAKETSLLAREGKAQDGARNGTQTLWAPRIPKAKSHKARHWNLKLEKIDDDVHNILDTVVTKKVQELYPSSRKESFHMSLIDRDNLKSEQEAGVQNEIDCDPGAR